jgi:hypothetical protein
MHLRPLALGAILLCTGCTARTPDPGTAGQRADVAISVPFRNRWWHHYERGLAWAEAGDDAAAEADLRACLRLRRTDSRLARTYGMHFVQCFARRELAAVLLRRGSLDEAEFLLRDSLAQEPSAKAEHLLETLAARRSGAARVAPAVPPRVAPRLELTALTALPEAAGMQRIVGRLLAPAGVLLWRTASDGSSQPVPAAGDGTFTVETPGGTTLALGPASGPDAALAPPLVTDAAPAQQPVLTLDGPDGGSTVADGRAWYRWQAGSADGLAELRVDDGDGQPLARLTLAGLRSGGTVPVLIPEGERTLRFTLVDRAGHSVTADRRVVSAAGPQQDRSLRAVALAVPLLAPRPGAMRQGDDPRLVAALLDDGRFRLVDARADAVLAQELTLVEAGYVDRSTAAAAGRRLASRYVIAGTMTRGARDAECFLRLIHSDSGEILATADAYAELSGEDAEGVFIAAAGRLRQVFPVLAGPITGDGSTLTFAAGRSQGAHPRVLLHVFPAGERQARQAPVASAEITEVEGTAARAVLRHGQAPAQGWAVGE